VHYIVKLLGMVNAVPDFKRLAESLFNGCSTCSSKLFGDRPAAMPVGGRQCHAAEPDLGRDRGIVAVEAGERRLRRSPNHLCTQLSSTNAHCQ